VLPHIDLKDPATHPRKTLDLGCGSGAWIISAASLWPQTRFVGFDLVPQITNLSVFEETSAPNSKVPPTKRFSLTQRHTTTTHPSGSHNDPTPTPRQLSERVRFVHGNFLINGLPFEDGEFDHVRIVGIARGVPEHKVCRDTGSPRREGLSLIYLCSGNFSLLKSIESCATADTLKWSRRI
jgi:SAM-dependent methyltransferase